jgi:hypothetical protein
MSGDGCRDGFLERIERFKIDSADGKPIMSSSELTQYRRLVTGAAVANTNRRTNRKLGADTLKDKGVLQATTAAEFAATVPNLS